MRRRSLESLRQQPREAVDQQTLDQAKEIVDAVRECPSALREYGERFGDIQPGGTLIIRRPELQAALERVSTEVRETLTRTAARIRDFADAQRASLVDMETVIPGGRAGVRFQPMKRAGCYAPGGRFPLPSSVLMTAVTARSAGVEEVWVASPKPTDETLAAAALAGADALVAVGGAQAIAALAYGADAVPQCDVIVGPGNRWVTAAKQLVNGRVAIDMLAGPSELVVWADDASDAQLAAADLLAQAEHDPDAVPMLVCHSERFASEVDAALNEQLETLPTQEIARQALQNGFTVVVEDDAQAVAACDLLAPEHLAVHVENAEARATALSDYGALFIGEFAAEVLGDYGAGPNHVLPTGGTARHASGLSVLTFLRTQSWMCVDAPEAASVLVEDAARLGRIEGLEAHARAADRRKNWPKR